MRRLLVEVVFGCKPCEGCRLPVAHEEKDIHPLRRVLHLQPAGIQYFYGKLLGILVADLGAECLYLPLHHAYAVLRSHA